jgi:putative NIF3 family GTP cyclohydrolase 1 type 2
MTVQQIIDEIIRYSAPPVKLEKTCDVLITGKPEMPVTGVVTTFMATADVIREAVKQGANLIITHEPTWWSGADDTGWLKNDPIYHDKRDLIEKENMAIWRYHDHLHMHKPDAVFVGLLKELGWEQYAVDPAPQGRISPQNTRENFAANFHDYYDIPETTLGALAAFFKEKLGMETVRVIGEAEMACSRVGILPGGGSLGLGSEIMPMQVMEFHDIHVIVCGDITEWTLPAYVHDARQLGHRRALLIIGHERSEEWGMKYMAQWLPGLIGGLTVTFVDAKEPFNYL